MTLLLWPPGLHPAGYRVPDSMGRCDAPGMMRLRRYGLACSFASFQDERLSPCAYPSGNSVALCRRCVKGRFRFRDRSAGPVTSGMRGGPRLRRHLETILPRLQRQGAGR